MKLNSKGVCMALFLLFVSVNSFALGQHQSAKQVRSKPSVEKWKTSWSSFVKELVSDAGGTAGPKANAKAVEHFASKQVVWEGTVDEQFPSDGSAKALKMQLETDAPTMNTEM